MDVFWNTPRSSSMNVCWTWRAAVYVQRHLNYFLGPHFTKLIYVLFIMSLLLCLISDSTVLVKRSICLLLVLMMGYVTAVTGQMSGRNRLLEEMCYRSTTSTSNMYHVETPADDCFMPLLIFATHSKDTNINMDEAKKKWSSLCSFKITPWNFTCWNSQQLAGS